MRSASFPLVILQSGRRCPSAFVPHHERDEDCCRYSDIGDHFIGPMNESADHNRDKHEDDQDIHPPDTDDNASSPSHSAV